MRKRTGARGAGIVEYAMVVIALVVAFAATAKAVGPRITAVGEQALTGLGGAAEEVALRLPE